MAITFALAQASVSSDGTNPTATFGSGPTEGNLLVVTGAERSGYGESGLSISGSGWTKRVARDVSLGDSTYRRSLSVWTKVAGSSEPSGIQVSGGSIRAVASEYEAGEAVTWTFEDSADNDNGTTQNSTTLATGTTGSIGAGDLLVAGIAYMKKDANTALNTTTFDSGLGGEEDFDAEDSYTRAVSTGFDQQSASGTKSSTATFSQSTNKGLVAAILVFSAEAGGGDLSIDISQSVNISESLTLAGLISDLTVDLFEQLNLSEYVLSSMNLGAISIDETLELAESLTSGVPIFPSRFDNINLSEFLSLLEIIAPSAFEQITITEYLNLLKDIGLSEFENIAINELIAASLSGGIDQSESIELSEFVSMLKDIGIDTAQQVTITEVITGIVSLAGISVSESVTINEAVTGILSVAGIEVGQDITVTEFINVLSTSDLPITDASESITITEALTLLFSSIPTTEIQNINVSEFVQALLTATGIDVHDSVNLSEYASLLMSLATISVSDTVTLSEAVTALIETTGANVYDTISITEYIQAILEITGISTSESVTISEFVYVTMVTVAGIMKVNFSVRRPGLTYSTRRPKITFH